VAVIVEGRGEDQTIRGLLHRVWYDHLKGDQIDVLRPLRKPQGKLLQEAGLKEAVDAAKIVLDRRPPDDFAKFILILIDSEGKCPQSLAPQLLRWAKEARADADIACVLPHHMFETWFAAAASSLAGVNDLPADLATPANPEENGLGKGWLKKLLRRRYKEPVDQPRFASKMDLALCRQNSPSFDKLCRELEKRLPRSTSTPASEEVAPGPSASEVIAGNGQ
jgi:hypothetical protein